jgi:hypothetical protein
MKSFEIWFKDLNPDAQKRYLEFHGVSSPEELNEDLAPITFIDLEE